jgi:hypothetical protein
MTDTTTPALPFDPHAAEHFSSTADAWKEEWEDHTEPRPESLRVTIFREDIDAAYEVLRQLAYARDEARLLAEKCAAWRGQYEDARARLEAVRSVAKEWCAYAEERTQDHPEAAFAAGNALGQLLRALDGDPEGV